MKPANRIPELDAARGICVLGMIIVHLLYDLTELYPVLSREYPPFFLFLKDWGGIAFFLISGIAVTLGHRHLRRGAVVFGCGLLVSAAMRLTGAMPIRFGVLHCLGVCMFLWGLFRKLPTKAIGIVGAALAVVGAFFGARTVSVPYLYPLGLTAPGFVSADYFPLLPYFGYFLLGAICGKRLYPDRRSLFGKISFAHPLLRFLCLCGRHSLFIYLIHQPLLILIIETALA